MTNVEYWKKQSYLIVKPSSFDEGIYEVVFNRNLNDSDKFITRELLVRELNTPKHIIVLNKKGNKIEYRNFITMEETIG